MQKLQLKLPQSWVAIAWIMAIAYYCLAFLPTTLRPMRTGIDPSWQYGITYAAVHKLTFGQDLLFTYGPLGYLIAGVPINDVTFYSILIFQILVHISLSVLGAFTLLQSKTNIEKIVLFISLLICFLSGTSIEIEILFIYVLLLSNRYVLHKKYIRFWAVGLGVFAGFVTLAKFTLAICTVGSLMLLLLSNFFKPVEPEACRNNNFLAVADAVMAILTISLIFFDPNYDHGFLKIGVCAILSALFGLVIGLGYPLLNQTILSKIRLPYFNQFFLDQGTSKANRRLLISYGFYSAYLLTLCINVFAFSTLIPFFKGALEISSGYSSAMSSPATGNLTAFTIAIFGLIAVGLMVLAVRNNFYLALPLLLILAISFKHSVIRQDEGHVWTLAAIAPFIIAIGIRSLQKGYLKTFFYFLYGCTLTFFLFVSTFTPLPVEGNVLEPGAVIKNLLHGTIYLEQTKAELQAEGIRNLSTEKLPPEMVDAIANKSIDIVPYRVSLVAANSLNWRPRPVFQSYAAYTRFLDHKNFESLSQNPRDYILYSFDSIDGRHPFFDEPETFFHVFCNYQPSAQFPHYIQAVALLKKRAGNICLPQPETKTVRVQMNTSQSVDLNDHLIHRAELQFQYSWFGKLCKIFFRTAPIQMQVNYLDGSQATYRVVPGNAQNGILISHLPRNKDEALALFKGALTSQVKSFSFFTSNPFMDQQNVEIKLHSYQLSLESQ